MTIKEFKKEINWDEQYQSYSDLSKRGISRKVSHGKNPWGFNEYTVYCIDGSIWEYQPEDQIYQRKIDE